MLDLLNKVLTVLCILCLINLNIVKVSKLEDLGVETAILSFDRKKSSLEVYELSSKGASNFLDSTDTVNNFALHFKGNIVYMKIHKSFMKLIVACYYIFSKLLCRNTQYQRSSQCAVEKSSRSVQRKI